MKIEYIGVSSAALVLGGIFTVLGGILGLIDGIGGLLKLQVHIGFIQGLGVGIVETLVMIIVYAICGLIVGIITGGIAAWAFNHSIKLFGGVEIKFKE